MNNYYRAIAGHQTIHHHGGLIHTSYTYDAEAFG